MSKIVNPSTIEHTNATTDALVATGSLSSDALARRRMLLKSLGKGSAIIAATAGPIHSLAAPVTINTTGNTQCIVSGMGSAIHSATPLTGTCKGSKPSSYSSITSWPGYTSNPDKFVVAGTPYSKSTTFRDVFGGNSSKKKLTDIMAVTAGTDTLRHWIAAWLNAGAGYNQPFGARAQNFPYSPAQVVARYNTASSGADGNSQSYTFFTTYLESL